LNPAFSGESGDVGPGGITADEVLHVRSFLYSGYVYDFRSPVGWVLSNGAAVSNCRCGMRYVAAPNTTLSKLVDPVKKELKTLPENFSGWLDQNVKNWRAIAKKIEKKPPADRLGLIYLDLQKQGGKGDLRDIARMILIGGIL
jgi:hypothetical protein